eukprot:9476283-Pyramimonas_sp.AAC.1
MRGRADHDYQQYNPAALPMVQLSPRESTACDQGWHRTGSSWLGLPSQNSGTERCTAHETYNELYQLASQELHPGRKTRADQPNASS